MKSSTMGLVAIAAAIMFVGALIAEVPLSSLSPLLLLLACPLMMILMIKGMHGGADGEHETHRRDQHSHH